MLRSLVADAAAAAPPVTASATSAADRLLIVRMSFSRRLHFAPPGWPTAAAGTRSCSAAIPSHIELKTPDLGAANGHTCDGQNDGPLQHDIERPATMSPAL